MKRKILGLMLVLVMVFTSLTGCSEPVTAESLIDNALTDVENMECEMNMAIEMEVSASGMTVDMSLDMSGDIETSKDIAHMDMTMSMDMMGMDMEETTETYAVVDGDDVTTYIYDKDYDVWYYTEGEAEDNSEELSSDMFEDLELEETDDGYEVTGLVKDVDELMSGMNSDDTTEALVDALKDIDVVATLIFNEDKEIEEMSIVFEVDEDEAIDIDGMGEATISKMEVSVEFKSLDGDEVELPEEVEDAMSEDEYNDYVYGSFDDDYEDDYYDDTEDDYYEDDTEDLGNSNLIPIGGITGTNPPSFETIYFTINDTQFTLDTITVDAIKALGYEIDDYSYVEGEPYSVEAGDYETISLYDDNVCGIYLYFKNNTSEAIDITECDIIGIDFGQNYEMLFEGGCHCPFTFMGLSAGATASDVEQVLGTPDGYSEYDTSVDYYYYLSDEGDSQLIVTIEESVGMTDIDFYNNLWD